MFRKRGIRVKMVIRSGSSNNQWGRLPCSHGTSAVAPCRTVSTLLLTLPAFRGQRNGLSLLLRRLRGHSPETQGPAGNGCLRNNDQHCTGASRLYKRSARPLTREVCSVSKLPQLAWAEVITTVGFSSHNPSTVPKRPVCIQ